MGNNNNYGNMPLEVSGTGNGTGQAPSKGAEMGKKFGKKVCLFAGLSRAAIVADMCDSLEMLRSLVLVPLWVPILSTPSFRCRERGIVYISC